MAYSGSAARGVGFLPGSPQLYLLAALGCTILESIPILDQIAQGPFFQQGEWLLSRAFHTQYKWLLYTTPKILIGVTGAAFLFLFLASFTAKYRSRLHAWRKPSLLIVSSIALVPLTVASLKALTGVYSPVDMTPYGGTQPHIGLLEQLWTYGVPSGGRSFPAGHASGGFALMSLYSLPVQKRWKRLLFGFGLFAGWAMGLYQMARGEHFLSHTLTAMFLALAIIYALDSFAGASRPGSGIGR